MKNIVTAAIILVVGVTAFFGGTLYKQRQFVSRRPAFMGQGGNNGGPGGFGQRGPGGGFPGAGQRGSGDSRQQRGEPVISGRLDRIDGDELILTTRFGTVKVTVDDKTDVKKAEEADAQDLEEKKDVIIEGQVDDDGNFTARSVIEK